MNDERLFTQFLKEYFDNIKEKLPQSYRARQLNNGGIEEQMVWEFETKFLKEPFMKALKNARGRIK